MLARLGRWRDVGTGVASGRRRLRHQVVVSRDTHVLRISVNRVVLFLLVVHARVSTTGHIASLGALVVVHFRL